MARNLLKVARGLSTQPSLGHWDQSQWAPWWHDGLAIFDTGACQTGPISEAESLKAEHKKHTVQVTELIPAQATFFGPDGAYY